MRSGPSAPPHNESAKMSYGATKSRPTGSGARATPVVGPNTKAPGDTGKSGRMPTGKNTAGILGKR